MKISRFSSNTETNPDLPIFGDIDVFELISQHSIELGVKMLF